MRMADGIVTGRLTKDEYEKNFEDAYPPLTDHEASVEASRCYFCYDAPCVSACPTQIDIPKFIQQIETGNIEGSAKTILDQNILGGMCARVCPTETLCEQVCVREDAEQKPVKIGRLQRHAVDNAINNNIQFYKPNKSTNKNIAVIGGGPAGLACAHRLAMYGHNVTIFDQNKKAGGLNEYGIAQYKTVDNFAQKEIKYITRIGNINVKLNQKIGTNISLENITKKYDAVFIAVGLTENNNLNLENENANGIINATEYIAQLRQTKNKEKMKVGRNVLVIGGGMTAIDVATQVKMLGAENVIIAYRNNKNNMNASDIEQKRATDNGVIIKHNLMPVKIITQNNRVREVTLEYTKTKKQKLNKILTGTGKTINIKIDQMFIAVGQKLTDDKIINKIETRNGRIVVNEAYRTNVNKIWAGGDCINKGEDLTVTAVAHGRDAAESINIYLTPDKINADGTYVKDGKIYDPHARQLFTGYRWNDGPDMLKAMLKEKEDRKRKRKKNKNKQKQKPKGQGGT